MATALPQNSDRSRLFSGVPASFPLLIARPTGRIRTDWTHERRDGSRLLKKRESMEKLASAGKVVREIRRKTGRRFSAAEKIRITIEGGL